MDDEVQLISDGDGLAVIGDPAAVERSVTRPWTGPDRCRAGSPAGSPSERSAGAAGRRRNATSKAE